MPYMAKHVPAHAMCTRAQCRAGCNAAARAWPRACNGQHLASLYTAACSLGRQCIAVIAGRRWAQLGVDCCPSRPPCRTVYDAGGDNHGTHVAGTIGAVHNGAGVLGVAPLVKMIGAKFLSTSGGSSANAIKALDYFSTLKVCVQA